MIIGLFGHTCAGKSMAAQKLGQLLNTPVRHCGEAVKALAAEQGISASQLSNEDHAAIDRQTRSAADSGEPLIVEGTFLDCVLGRLNSVVLIRLDCEVSERGRRFSNRENGGPEEFLRRDQLDDQLRVRLYASDETVRQWPSVDSSHLSPDETVNQILRLLPDGQ